MLHVPKKTETKRAKSMLDTGNWLTSACMQRLVQQPIRKGEKNTINQTKLFFLFRESYQCQFSYVLPMELSAPACVCCWRVGNCC